MFQYLRDFYTKKLLSKVLKWYSIQSEKQGANLPCTKAANWVPLRNSSPFALAWHSHRVIDVIASDGSYLGHSMVISSSKSTAIEPPSRLGELCLKFLRLRATVAMWSTSWQRNRFWNLKFQADQTHKILKHIETIEIRVVSGFQHFSGSFGLSTADLETFFFHSPFWSVLLELVKWNRQKVEAASFFKVQLGKPCDGRRTASNKSRPLSPAPAVGDLLVLAARHVTWKRHFKKYGRKMKKTVREFSSRWNVMNVEFTGQGCKVGAPVRWF